jgi:hypothetical protein
MDGKASGQAIDSNLVSPAGHVIASLKDSPQKILALDSQTVFYKSESEAAKCYKVDRKGALTEFEGPKKQSI